MVDGPRVRDRALFVFNDWPRLRVLMVTGMYPTAQRPHSGTFVKSQVESLGVEGVDSVILHIGGVRGCGRR